MLEKREQILQTAYQLFMDKDFRSVRMIDIAAKAGVAVGTLYQYYPTKQALFDALNMPFPAEDTTAKTRLKKEIIAKALLVFGEFGYEGTSMDMIAERCGISKPALYQHYTSKDALFLAIFNEADLMKELSAVAFPDFTLPVASVLHRIGLKFILTLLEPERLNLIRTALAETRRFPEIGNIIYEKAVAAVSGHLARYLEQLSAEGILNARDAVFTARAFLGQLFSFVVLERLLTNQSGFSPENMVDQSVDLLLYGIQRGEITNET